MTWETSDARRRDGELLYVLPAARDIHVSIGQHAAPRSSICNPSNALKLSSPCATRWMAGHVVTLTYSLLTASHMSV